MNIEAAANVKK